MQNLLIFLAKFGNTLLFVFLEILCIYLIINYNQTQKEIYLNSSGLFSGYILDKKENFKSYVGLKKVNEQLHQENAKLLQRNFNYGRPQVSIDTIQRDSSTRYLLRPAGVINNSVRFRNNNITLDKGAEDGIKKGMGVISNDGLVGIIRNTSNNYSQAISVLNSQTKISAKIKRNHYHGNLVWKSRSPLRMQLEAVPKHADIQTGDTLITSGFSSIFPEGIMIGTIENFEVPAGSSNYEINVILSNDLAKLHRVFVIENFEATQIKALENQVTE